MHPSRRRVAACAAATAVAVLAGPAFALDAPRVEGAWARPTVAGQSGGGGFLKITGGSTADRLLGASAGISKVVELHTMEMDGNVMRMRRIEGVDVPAGATVEFKPGGLHVMFMGLQQTLKPGASFPLTLQFQKAGEVKVQVQVQTAPGMAGAPAGGARKP